MFPLISIASQIASLALPSLGKWIAGDDGEKVASGVVDIASRITGADTPEAALTKLQADPQAVLALQRELLAHENQLLNAETDRLREINATMRAEASNGDAYVRRWRPTWGYVTAAAWAIQALALLVVAIGGVVVTVNGQAGVAAVLFDGAANLLSAVSVQWSVALGVLGVGITARSGDKRAAAGIAPTTGGIASLVGKVIGR